MSRPPKEVDRAGEHDVTPAGNGTVPESSAGNGGPSLLRRLASGTGWQALAQTLPLVFNLALTPFIIHGLGTEIYGIFLLVAVLQQFVSSVDGGIGPGVRRYFGIYSGRGERAAITSLLVTMFTLLAAASLVVCGVAFFFAPQVIGFFPGTAVDPDGSVLLFRVMVIIVAVSQERALFTQVLWTSNRFGIQAIADLVGFGAYAAGMVLTVFHGYGLAGIAWTLVAQQVVSTLILLPPAIRLLDRRGLRFVPRGLLKEFFAYAWKIQVSGILSLISAQGDAVLVGRFAAPQMTAFGTGASFATTLRGIPLNASTPMEANIVRALGATGPEGAAGEAAKIQRFWVRLIAGWIAVGAPAAAFGVNAWLHLGTELPGQVAGVVLTSYGITLIMLIQRFWMNALGHSGMTMSHDLINTGLNIGLTIPLIIAYGALGTITATLLAALVASIYMTWIGQRLATPIPVPWGQIPWLWVAGAAAASGGLSWSAYHYLAGSVVPYGPLSLLLIGACAAPILFAYLVHAIGWSRVRGLVGSITSRGRGAP